MSNAEKAGTFEIRKVLSKSVNVLKKHYLSIALLCVLMFLVSNFSGFLASYFQSVNNIVNAFLAFCFILLYSLIGLSLFKVVLSILDKEVKGGYSGYLPTTRYYDQNQIFLYFFYICKTRRRLQLIHSAEVYLVRGYLPRFSYYRHP